MWRHRAAVLLFALAAAATALTQSLLSPRTYRATVTLAAAGSKIGDGGVPTIQIAAFVPLVENDALIESVIREFRLDRPPQNASRATFRTSVLNVDEVRNSNLLNVSVTLQNPDLAAKVVNRVGERAVERSREVSRQEAVRARDEIGAQLEEARARLDAAETQLRDFRQIAQVDLLQTDVDALLDKRGNLLGLDTAIQAERGRVAKGEEELKKREAIKTIRRTVDSDPAMTESARAAGATSSDILGLQTTTEVVNPVYEQIDSELALSRSRLAGLEQERNALADVRRLDRTPSSKITQLYARETQLKRLEAERDLALKVYQDVATRFEGARLQVAGRSAELQLLTTALPPQRPQPRGTVLKTAVGFVLGLVLAGGFFVAKSLGPGLLARP